MSDNEMDAACAVIEQLMEPCEKCGLVAKGARWAPDAAYEMPLCETCWADQDGFAEWFKNELEAAMQESGQYERLTGGKWRRKV